MGVGRLDFAALQSELNNYHQFLFLFINLAPVFRGCADSQYAFDAGCNRELEPVQIVQGKRSVDVEILLCFCNEENCNTSLSGAQEGAFISKSTFLICLFSSVMFMLIQKHI